jgi:hypothetical protein
MITLTIVEYVLALPYVIIGSITEIITTFFEEKTPW